ncbi:MULTISPECIES: hypothetical protein [unclassified Streptomyces]|uniref:hypothetical protein n=1 Tax=unclassified Streptomyces TaxID=2593676 RepID=UPI0011E716F2|nr:hypothetical protein [Streptomyces sp. sk2.1]
MRKSLWTSGAVLTATALSLSLSTASAAPLPEAKVCASTQAIQSVQAQSRASVKKAIRDAFEKSRETQAINVATCESNLNPKAFKKTRYTSYYGLFQLSIADWKKWSKKGEDKFSAKDNAKVAHRIVKNEKNKLKFRTWGACAYWPQKVRCTPKICP